MFPLTQWRSVWVGGCAVAGVLAAVPALRHSASPAAEPVRITQAAAVPVLATAASQTSAAPMYVHVTGEVARPGLYQMRPGARVMDAVTGAGGATANADLSLLNLASPLHDGQKLRVPRTGDAPETAPDPVLVRADPAPTPAPTAFAPPAQAPASSGKLRHPGEGTVHLNSATEGDLQRLPGVGPSTAAKILDYRTAHGGFRTAQELMEVKGIGPKKFAKMQPFVSVP